MSEIEWTDLGDGFGWQFFTAGDADIRAGILLAKEIDGESIPIGACWFDTPEVRSIPWAPGEEGDDRRFWTLHSLDPLHLEPSIQTHEFRYGTDEDGVDVPAFHGFIRDGHWVGA